MEVMAGATAAVRDIRPIKYIPSNCSYFRSKGSLGKRMSFLKVKNLITSMIQPWYLISAIVKLVHPQI